MSKPGKSAYAKQAAGKILDILRVLLMIGIIIGLLLMWINFQMILPFIGIYGMLIVTGAGFLIEFILHKLYAVTWQIQADARNDIEFDENGLFRAKNEIQRLSKKEREEIGKRQLAEVERILGTGTLKKITREGSATPMKDLKAMTGLVPVKRKVKELSARMEFDKKNGIKDSDNGRHMCLFGNPGTGKTTIVKIITGILYREGVIKYNQFLEVDGNSLRGDTARETNEKINLLVRFSKGKVLFIDEAYAMFTGSTGTSQDVIATLIKLMEDHRKDFVLIVAGYEDEMKQMIEANPGFKSRICTYLHFPDYSNEELCQIFSSMANAENLYVPAETIERLDKRFTAERRQRYFGNARTARTVLDESVSSHALHLKEGKIKKDDRFKILPIDVSVNVSTV